MNWVLGYVLVGVVLSLMVELTGNATEKGLKQMKIHATIICFWPIFVPVAFWVTIRERRGR